MPAGVFLILLIALRDPWACLNLVATMILTYAFALGITHAVFVDLLGDEGLDWKVPYFLFVLLVAVGVDYNVFLMTRLHEEARLSGLHEGIKKAVAATGGLITSAAAITACSFASLLLSPLASLRQLGFALVVGVTVDALLVRPVLVPCGHWLMKGWIDRGEGDILVPPVEVGRPSRLPEIAVNVAVGRSVDLNQCGFSPGKKERARVQYRGKGECGPGPDPCWSSRRIPNVKAGSHPYLRGPFDRPRLRESDPGSRGSASKGRGGGGDHRVPARQRAAGAALPRSVPAQGHGQPDGLRRVAARGVRRDGHGAPARAHALQGDAHSSRHPQGCSRIAEPSSTARHGSIGPITMRRSPPRDENLEFALKLEADRLVNSFIKGADLATEMTVVRNEFEMGENSPENVLEQRMMSVAYEWHNYGKSTIGNRSDIERVPIERLQGFYRKHYRPDNALLVVAGRFDDKKALDLIAKYFGTVPRPEAQDRHAPIPRSRRRTASGSSRSGASATWAWSVCFTTCRPGPTRSSPRCRS